MKSDIQLLAQSSFTPRPHQKSRFHMSLVTYLFLFVAFKRNRMYRNENIPNYDYKCLG